jgi:hypothetical protein
MTRDSKTTEKKMVSGNVAIVLGIICIVLVAGLVTTIAVSSLNSQSKNVQKQVKDPQNTADFNRFFLEFGNVSVQSPNLNFSPPVSMYRALLIALESGGWTTTSLKNMTINVRLDYCAFYNDFSSPSGWETLGNCTFRTNPPVTGFDLIYPVTHPPADWSPQQINGITYRYVWTIIVEYSGSSGIPPPGYYYVDAATAELVPTGIL